MADRDITQRAMGLPDGRTSTQMQSSNEESDIDTQYVWKEMKEGSAAAEVVPEGRWVGVGCGQWELEGHQTDMSEQTSNTYSI